MCIRDRYIEDIYLNQACRLKYLPLLLGHAVQRAKDSGCCRVEMRVLKNYNMGCEAINKAGFCKIDKWDVFRFTEAL